MQLGIGILAAYVRMLKTGAGGHVEVSMQDAIASYSRVDFLAGETVGDPVPRVGNNLRGLAPTNTYACKPFGPNDYAYVVANTGPMLERLLVAIGLPELVDDPRVATVAARRENEEWLQGVISAWTGQRTKHEAMADLSACGVPGGATFDSGDIFNDPHLKQRGMVQTVDHPIRGPVEILGNLIQIDHTPSRVTPAPLLGADTGAALNAELGLSTAEISVLRASGVI